LTFVDGGATCPLSIKKLVGESTQLDLNYHLNYLIDDEEFADLDDWVECVDWDVETLGRVVRKTRIQVASLSAMAQVQEKLEGMSCWPRLRSNLELEILPF